MQASFSGKYFLNLFAVIALLCNSSCKQDLKCLTNDVNDYYSKKFEKQTLIAISHKEYKSDPGIYKQLEDLRKVAIEEAIPEDIKKHLSIWPNDTYVDEKYARKHVFDEHWYLKDVESLASYMTDGNNFYTTYLKKLAVEKYKLVFFNTVTSDAEPTKCSCETDVKVPNTNFSTHVEYQLQKTDDGNILISEN